MFGAFFLPRPASDRRQHRHRVAVLDRGLEAAEEADVLVVEVDVDEAAQLLAVDEPLAQAAVRGVQVVEELVQRRAGPLNRLGATGVAAQDRGDANLNGHVSTLLSELLYAMDGNLYRDPIHSEISTGSSVTSPSMIRYERNSVSPSSRVDTRT